MARKPCKWGSLVDGPAARREVPSDTSFVAIAHAYGPLHDFIRRLAAAKDGADGAVGTGVDARSGHGGGGEIREGDLWVLNQWVDS